MLKINIRCHLNWLYVLATDIYRNHHITSACAIHTNQIREHKKLNFQIPTFCKCCSRIYRQRLTVAFFIPNNVYIVVHPGVQQFLTRLQCDDLMCVNLKRSADLWFDVCIYSVIFVSKVQIPIRLHVTVPLHVIHSITPTPTNLTNHFYWLNIPRIGIAMQAASRNNVFFICV